MRMLRRGGLAADDAAALEQGMAEKAAEFRAQGAQVYRRD